MVADVSTTVQLIHELLAVLLNRTIDVGHEEQTESEIAQFVQHVTTLRRQLLAQMHDLSTTSTAGLSKIEEANIARLLERLSFPTS
jgi:hypothetical protein